MVKNHSLTGGWQNSSAAHPKVKHHLSDHLATYRELLATSPITYPNQPLLTMGAAKDLTTVTVSKLVQGLKIMLGALNMDAKLCSLHSLR